MLSYIEENEHLLCGDTCTLRVLENAVLQNPHPETTSLDITMSLDSGNEVCYYVRISREYEDEGECFLCDIIRSGFGNTISEAVLDMLEPQNK